MNKLNMIYKILKNHFGHQNWWPVTPEGKIIPEYSGGPRNEKQQLEVCFGAILTQSTAWKNAEKAIIELNKKNLINIFRILRIEKEELAGIIKSSGYCNQKAGKLKNFCLFLSKNYNGSLSALFREDIFKLRNGLLSVKGIGPETADSIILYAAKKPIFVVDAYTKRIFGRIGFKENSYDEFQKMFMNGLENSEKLFNEFHALIVELGKNICKTKPLCKKCPLRRVCEYKKSYNN